MDDVRIDEFTGEVTVTPIAGGLVHQKQPSINTCLPTSFAMVIAMDASEMIKDIGHDDARGFHVQECLSVALSKGWLFSPHEFDPLVESPKCDACDGWCQIQKQSSLEGDYVWVECGQCRGTGIWRLEPKLAPLGDLMLKFDGVLTGKIRGADVAHAVAWDKKLQKCLDPHGMVMDLKSFEADTFWLGVKFGG